MIRREKSGIPEKSSLERRNNMMRGNTSTPWKKSKDLGFVETTLKVQTASKVRSKCKQLSMFAAAAD